MTTTKVHLVNQMKRMNRYLVKLSFLSAVIYFKNCNTKHIFTQFHSVPVQEILLLLSNVSNRFSLS